MTFKYFNVKNGLTTGEIALHSANGNVVANVFVGGLNVTGVGNLGNVSNLVITGGSANYVLSTDGQGNLSWVAQSGGGGGSSNSISNGNTSVTIANTITATATATRLSYPAEVTLAVSA